MIKYDFKTFMDVDGINNYEDKIHTIRKKLDLKSGNDIFLDVNKCVTKKELDKIKVLGKYIKSSADVFLVIGVGGSYMGSRSLIELFKNKSSVEIIYTGYDLSSNNFKEIIDYIENKEIVVNCISKSGNTFEVNLIFSKVLEIMKRKYNKKELSKRVIITTNNKNGKLINIAHKYHFPILKMPNVSGRYSILTSAGLLPMAVCGINIDNLLLGFQDESIDKCFIYAVIRDLLYKNGRKVEAFTVYDEKLLYFNEWLKQLFAETQGKNKRGILPISMFNTRDMHSLGQYLNDGEDMIFSTVINIVNNEDVMIKNKSLNKINNMVMLNIAKCSKPSIIINIDKLNEKNMGRLIYFFMTSAAIGGYLMGVNPYNQPGVNEYKRLIRESIKCMK